MKIPDVPVSSNCQLKSGQVYWARKGFYQAFLPGPANALHEELSEPFSTRLEPRALQHEDPVGCSSIFCS